MQFTALIFIATFLPGHALLLSNHYSQTRRQQKDSLHPGSYSYGLDRRTTVAEYHSQSQLERREPGDKDNASRNVRRAAKPRHKGPPKPLTPKQQANNARKAQQNAANAQKKAKAQAAKAEKQKQKDQKHVQDNLNRERKAQDKAGRDAMKNLSNVQRGTARDKSNEEKKFASNERRLQKNLANSQRQLAKEKGRKGFGNAQKKFSQAQAALSNEANQHKARLDKVYASSMNAMNRDRGKLDKALTKAHTNEFDAGGRAKDHPSALAKFGKVMSYLGPALLSVIPGVGAPLLGAMAGARIASIAVQTAAKEGAKQGVKQGTKQGIKQGIKKGGQAVDWKVQTQAQIKTSQKNKDAKLDAFEQQRKKLTANLRQRKRDLSDAGEEKIGRIYLLRVLMLQNSPHHSIAALEQSAPRAGSYADMIDAMIWDD